MKNLLKTSIIFLLVVYSNQSFAQQDSTSISTENIEVIRNYEAIIQQAKRKKILVKKSGSELPAISYSYNVKSNVNLDFERPEPVIRPKTYKLGSKQSTDIKDGRLYGAYGNYSTLKLGGAYHYYIEDWVEAGIKLDHMSAKDQNIAFQKYGNTDGELYLGYFLNPKTKASLELRGGNSKHHTPLLNFQDSLLQQNFNNLGASLGLSHNSFENTGLSIRSKFSFDRINQTVDTVSENRLRAELNVLKRINDEFSFELPLSFTSTNFKSIVDTSYTDIVLSPYVRYNGKQFNLNAGLEFVLAGDDSFIFPILKLDVENIYEELDLSIFTQSNYRRNNLFYLSEFVPYYLTQSTPLNPNYFRSYNLQFDYQYGILTPSLQIAYNQYTGSANALEIYDQQRPQINAFDRNEFTLSPKFGIKTEMIELDFVFRYNTFLDKANEIEFSNVSKIELSLNAKEKLFKDKLILTQNLMFNGNRDFLLDNTLIDLVNPYSSYIDLSLGLEYRAHKSISIFAHGTNLLASEYQLWFLHPVFERQFWGGIKVNL